MRCFLSGEAESGKNLQEAYLHDPGEDCIFFFQIGVRRRRGRRGPGVRRNAMKKTGRLVLDGVMAAVFLLLMAARETGNAAHEWLGMGLACLAAWHVWLNRHWFTALWGGRYSPSRTLRLVLNALLCLFFAGALASAVPVSRTVFAFLGLEGDLFSRTLHVFSAHWAFLFAALHAGLYARRVVAFPSGRGGGASLRVLFFLIGAAAALFGACAFPRRDMAYVLTMQSAFLAWGGQEGAVSLLLDYGAMFFLLFWTVWICTLRGRGKAKAPAGKTRGICG